MKDEWLGTGEAADELGLTLQGLYRVIDEGRLPTVRVGRVIRIRRSDVEQLGEAGGGTVPPGPRR